MQTIKTFLYMLWGAVIVWISIIIKNRTDKPTTTNKIGKVKGRDSADVSTTFPTERKKKLKFLSFRKRSK